MLLSKDQNIKDSALEYICNKALSFEQREEFFKENIENIFKDIHFLESDYPGFYEWYHEKVIPGLENGEREILVCFVEENGLHILAGISILKFSEKKICTLRVSEKYRNNGVGGQLFEKSFEVLDTKKPLITISEKRITMFKRYIDKYEFKETQQLKGVYGTGRIEIVFNGEMN